MGVEGGEIRSCKIRSSLGVTLRFLGSHIKCFFLAGWKNDLETTSSPLLPTPPSVMTQIHCPFSCFFHLQPSLMGSSLRRSSVWLMPLDKQMTHHVYFTWRQVFFFCFLKLILKKNGWSVIFSPCLRSIFRISLSWTLLERHFSMFLRFHVGLSFVTGFKCLESMKVVARNIEVKERWICG